MAAHPLLSALLKPGMVLVLASCLGLDFWPLAGSAHIRTAYASNQVETQSEPAGGESAEDTENTQETVDEIITVEGVARMSEDGPVLETHKELFWVDGVDLEVYEDKRVRITGLVDTDEQNRRWLVVEKFEMLKK